LRSAFGVDAERDDEIEGDRYGLAFFQCRLEGGVANDLLGVFVEAEADGATGNYLLDLAVGADDCMIKSHSGDSIRLSEFVGGWVDRGNKRGF